MGHCGDFGYAGATARKEALQKRSVMIPALWAVARDLVMRYDPLCRILLFAIGHSAGVSLRYGPGFGYAL